MVICAQERRWSELDGIRPDLVLVSEDLATGGIRAHLVLAKGNGDTWIKGKIKDDIEEFGYGGAPVRIKSDQEPAIVDNRTAVIAKHSSVPTIPVNSPAGDSQSNGQVENAIEKVRNMVKTILSSLESKWGIRVTRDHPVHPWTFEWAANLMTRNAHVGDFGKTAVQLIRSSRSSRNIANFGKKGLVQAAETLQSSSRKHGRHFLGWHFSGHETALR